MQAQMSWATKSRSALTLKCAAARGEVGKATRRVMSVAARAPRLMQEVLALAPNSLTRRPGCARGAEILMRARRTGRVARSVQSEGTRAHPGGMAVKEATVRARGPHCSATGRLRQGKVACLSDALLQTLSDLPLRRGAQTCAKTTVQEAS